ncbi:MAG: cell wall hydrolase [Clostridia bacterium]
MKVFYFKKYTVFLFFIFLLIISLYISVNNVTLNIPELFAADKKSSSISTTSPSTGSDVTQLLARLINGEARGEPYEGQVAVGAVVLNRVKSSEFPNTISGVIYQKGQFTCVTDGQFNKPFEKGSTVLKAAKEAMNGADPSNGALYFYDPRYTKSKWLFSLKTIKTIGGHRFANEEKKK